METPNIKNLPKNGHKDSGYFKLQETSKEEYQNYLALNLSDPMINAKTYWSLLKTFYNAKKYQSYIHF